MASKSIFIRNKVKKDGAIEAVSVSSEKYFRMYSLYLAGVPPKTIALVVKGTSEMDIKELARLYKWRSPAEVLSSVRELAENPDALLGLTPEDIAAINAHVKCRKGPVYKHLITDGIWKAIKQSQVENLEIKDWGDLDKADKIMRRNLDLEMPTQNQQEIEDSIWGTMLDGSIEVDAEVVEEDVPLLTDSETTSHTASEDQVSPQASQDEGLGPLPDNADEALYEPPDSLPSPPDQTL